MRPTPEQIERAFAQDRGAGVLALLDAPEPKYKQGDWFVSASNPRHQCMITDAPMRQAGAWLYAQRSAQSGILDTSPSSPAFFEDTFLTTLWLPIPKPPTLAAESPYALTGECRVPEPGELWACAFGLGHLLVTPQMSPGDAFGGRRWILRLKAAPAPAPAAPEPIDAGIVLPLHADPPTLLIRDAAGSKVWLAPGGLASDREVALRKTIIVALELAGRGMEMLRRVPAMVGEWDGLVEWYQERMALLAELDATGVVLPVPAKKENQT